MNDSARFNYSSSSLFSSANSTIVFTGDQSAEKDPESLLSKDPESLLPIPLDDLQTRSLTPTLPPQPLFPSTPISTLPPILSSTPAGEDPNTQDFALRLAELRTVDDIDTVFLRREIETLRRENEDLKSENVALRLQSEEDEREMNRLKQLVPPTPTEQQQQQTSSQQQLKANYFFPLTWEQHQQQRRTSSAEYKSFISKSKKKRKKKREREWLLREAEAETTLPPGCTTPPLPSTASRPSTTPTTTTTSSTTTPPTQPSASLPNLFVFHDSNFAGVTPEELRKTIDPITKKNNNNNNKYNIILHKTFTLPQTLHKIRHTTFKNNDRVILGIITNDARQTRHRPRRTPDSTKQLQTEIIQHLIAHIPRQNLTWLEAPPLFDSSTSDIFAYNRASFQLSRLIPTLTPVRNWLCQNPRRREPHLERWVSSPTSDPSSTCQVCSCRGCKS